MFYANYTPAKVIGNADVYGSTDTSSYRMAMPYNMSEDGNINSISIYHEGGSGDCLLAVYTDDGYGEPDYRIAITESTAINSTAGFQTIELTEPLSGRIRLKQFCILCI